MSDDPTTNPNSSAPAVAPVLDVEKYAGMYVAIRDKIDQIKERHAEELKQYQDGLKKIEGLVLPYLQATGQDGAKTKQGTFSVLDKYSASAEDPEIFRRFVIDQERWDIADWKPNVASVQGYLNENKMLPPGVKLNAIKVLGCRRPSKKAEK